jgi:hypothetical protein
MSLRWHLEHARQSQIGQYLQQRFSQTARLTKDTNPQLKAVKTILPTVATASYPYGTIGMAIDYRIRYYFAVTPSRQASMGARSLPYQKIGGALVEGPYSLELIESFFTRLNATLETIRPVGRRLEQAAERILARYCYVLSLFEEVFRNASTSQLGSLFVPAPKKSVEELLAIPQDAWIDDLCAMSTLFYDKYHYLLSCPFHLNPGFAAIGDMRGADADIIVDGCLIEIKASKQQSIEPAWLRQIAGYMLLDFDDRYHIHSVGIYMARQGLLFTWPVADFLSFLTGDDTSSLVQLRQEFRVLCQSTRN